MKKTFLTLSIFLALATTTAQAQFTYTSSNGAITITGYTGSGGAVTIPATINGLPVTSIGDNAFGYASLTSITIPNSVTSIGIEAFFECYDLTNVTMGNGVANIGDSAFESCESLTNVVFGSGVISIGNGAFSDTALTGLSVPASVTNISDFAFADCWSLASVNFRGNVPAVVAITLRIDRQGDPYYGGSFAYDPAVIYYLTDTAGWSNSFGGLPTVLLDAPPQFGTTADGWNYVSDQVQNTLITGYAGSNNAVLIPSIINDLPVTGIAPYAFAFASVTSVTIPNTVTTIADEVFPGCYSLTSIYFIGNAPNADAYAFLLYNDDLPHDPTTVYYLPGTVGWDDFSANTGLPIAQWFLPHPLILNQGPGFGVQSNQFGFTISWATNVPVVIETCTDLSNPIWLPVSTNTLVGGASYFSDPESANLPNRFYRLRSQ